MCHQSLKKSILTAIWLWIFNCSTGGRKKSKSKHTPECVSLTPVAGKLSSSAKLFSDFERNSERVRAILNNGSSQIPTTDTEECRRAPGRRPSSSSSSSFSTYLILQARSEIYFGAVSTVQYGRFRGADGSTVHGEADLSSKQDCCPPIKSEDVIIC